MKEVKRYECEDGRIFVTAGEAQDHDNYLRLEKWYDTHFLCGNYAGSVVDFIDLQDWLISNVEVVKEIIQGY